MNRTVCSNGMVDTCCENYDNCILGYEIKHEWVGLTTDELVDLVIKHAGLPTKLAEAIEAKLKEKNAL